jgi:hypothetical protein
VNFLANYLPINGVTTADVSDSFPVLFTPAGYVFAIWGLIYLLLIGFTVYAALPSQQNNPRLARVGYLFSVSNLLNATWIFLWHYRLFSLTLLVMVGLLVTLIAIYVRLGIGRQKAARVERALVDLPFSVYLGWITVATVANTTDFLYYQGWNGGALGPQPWTIVMILIASLLAVLMIHFRGEIAYPLVLVWAFIGIAQKQAPYPSIVVAAWGTAVALVIFIALQTILAFRDQRLIVKTNPS